MLAGIRSRLTFANVVLVIALFIALGAGAYAAGLAPDSVKSKHIVNGQVKSPDVRDDGLTGVDVDESSLDSVPLADSALQVDGADICKGVAHLQASPGVADEEQLCEDGAVGISASCSMHPGMIISAASVLAQTTQDNALIGSSSMGGDLDFDASESPKQLDGDSDSSSDGLRGGSTTVEHANVATDSGDLVSLSWTIQVNHATDGSAYCDIAYAGFA